MTVEYTGKSFKSGNSVAIRVPAALGVEPDREWIIIENDGGLMMRAKPKARQTIDISGFAGKLPGFQPAPREDFEERPSTIARRAALSKE